MDVRCERCRAQYVFDDEQVTPQGLTVQCTSCGYVFKVKKKELVVTVPVRPEDVTEPPMLATAAAPRPAILAEPSAARTPVDAPQHGWSIRQASGATLAFTELTTLQRWIVERKVARDDEVSQGSDAWVRLGAIGELEPFFAVVEDADRGRRPAQAIRPGGTASYPPPPFPPPSAFAPHARPGGPAAARSAAPAPASVTSDLDPEELAAVRGRKGGRPRLAVVLLLLVTLGAVAYAVAPGLLRPQPGPSPAPAAAPPAPAPPPAARPAPAPAPAPEPVSVPLTIELGASPPGSPEPAAAAPAPPGSPEPAAAPAVPHAGPKALIGQARALREKGETARALDLFGQVLTAEPDNVEALTGRGLCYFELGQYAPAEASFQRALRLDQDHPEATMGLAETYRQQGKKTEALVQFERYLAAHPDGEEAAVARYAISQLKE